MSNHTPGPWEFNGGYIFSENETVLAEVEPLEGFSDAYGDHVANGKLMAAAPELFEALKGMLTCEDSGSVAALRAAHNALVKAAGEDW